MRWVVLVLVVLVAASATAEERWWSHHDFALSECVSSQDDTPKKVVRGCEDQAMRGERALFRCSEKREVLEGGRVVEFHIDYIFPDKTFDNVYYRDRDRCNAAIAAHLAKQGASKKSR